MGGVIVGGGVTETELSEEAPDGAGGELLGDTNLGAGNVS